MSRVIAAPAGQKGHPAPRGHPTRLSGPTLALARAGWVGGVLLVLAVFVVLLPVYTTQLDALCPAATCAPAQLTPSDLRALHIFGQSVGGYRTLSLMLSLLWAGGWFVVAAVIFWRKSDDWMALLTAFWMVIEGTVNVAAIVGAAPSPWQYLATILNSLAIGGLVLVFCLFPDGRFVPRWSGWGILAWCALSILLSFAPTSWHLGGLSQLLAVGISLGLIAAQVYRYCVVSTQAQRQQTKWVVFAVVLSLLVFAGWAVLAGVLGVLGFFAALVLAPLPFFASLVIPVAFGIAILRSRLWDVDALIKRTLVYGSLTALLALVYFGSVIVMQRVAVALAGPAAADNPLILVVSTLLIAALFTPLRRRVQATIDRRFFRSKYDAARTLEAFATSLRTQTDLAALSNHLVAAVEETMRPAHVSLWLASPTRMQRAGGEASEGMRR